MKKIITLFFAILIAVSMLGGCGNEEKPKNKETEPFFEEHNLNENLLVNGEKATLEGGVGYFYDDFSKYYTGPATWTVEQGDTVKLEGGLKELHFTVVCSFKKSDVEGMPQNIKATCSSDLYDYYTGIYLADKHNVGNKEHSDNKFSYTYDVEGKEITVDFSYSVKWKNYSGAPDNVMTKEYIVRCPEDYDGIVFCAIAQPDNIEDFKAKRALEDGVDAYKPITECKYVDAHRTLRCRIR